MTIAETEAAEDFRDALRRHAPSFDVRPSGEEERRLLDYYLIVVRWNARLHLVAPCTAGEFAVRHVLESLVALPFLSEGARILDVGSGAGLPIIPCLIMRAGLRATLIESSQKKAVFLREALRVAGAHERAAAIAKRFEEIRAPETDFVTVRAIERFTEKFQELVSWSAPMSTLLFFGGPSLRAEIERAGLDYQPVLIPESERRFLFVIRRGSRA